MSQPGPDYDVADLQTKKTSKESRKGQGQGGESSMEEWRRFSNGEEYGGFRFRGEGLSNVVIGAVRRHDNQKVVWRFRKQRKTRLLNEDSDAINAQRYIKTEIAPLLGRKLCSVPSLVGFDYSDVEYLCQLDCLEEYFPWNMTREGWEGTLLALEMPDFTSLPISMGTSNFRTITVEVKPKQGFQLPLSPLRPLPLTVPDYCINCLSQYGKFQNGQFSQFYQFCPSDLFSGSLPRTVAALRNLLLLPHHNLRIFLDGNLVHSEECRISEPILESLLFPETQGGTGQFLEAVARILTGSTNPSKPFSIDKESVLGSLLQGQKLDSIGIWNASEIYKSLPEELREELRDPYFLYGRGKKKLRSPDTGPLRLLKGYLTAATLRDCSVLVTLKQVDGAFAHRLLAESARKGMELSQPPENPSTSSLSAGESSSPRVSSYSNTTPPPSAFSILSLPNPIDGTLHFAYRVAVVDLDAKSAKKLQSNRQKLIDSLQGLEEHIENYGPIPRPCLSQPLNETH